MNIDFELKQGTQEWLNARSGFVSASRAGDIYTATGKLSAKAKDYTNKLIAERLMGKSAESGFTSEAMQRGVEMEESARLWYEMTQGVDVKEAGIIVEGAYSCSPDGLIMDGEKIIKGLEIKCPLAHTHVSYLMKGKVPTQYLPQIQSSMFVSGANEWDFLSYHPDLSPLLITVKRDDEWIEGFAQESQSVLLDVLDGIEKINEVAA